MYCVHAQSNFDLNAINNSKMTFAYDAMYGSGITLLRD